MLRLAAQQHAGKGLGFDGCAQANPDCWVRPKGAAMVADGSKSKSGARTAAQFATTHWSAVLAAGHDCSPDAREALETLCRCLAV